MNRTKDSREPSRSGFKGTSPRFWRVVGRITTNAKGLSSRRDPLHHPTTRVVIIGEGGTWYGKPSERAHEREIRKD